MVSATVPYTGLFGPSQAGKVGGSGSAEVEPLQAPRAEEVLTGVRADECAVGRRVVAAATLLAEPGSARRTPIEEGRRAAGVGEGVGAVHPVRLGLQESAEAVSATNARGVGSVLPGEASGIVSALVDAPAVDAEGVTEDGRDSFERMFGFGLAPGVASAPTSSRDHLVDLAPKQFSRDYQPPHSTQCLRIVRPGRASGMLVVEVVGVPAWRGKMIQVRACQHCSRGDIWTRMCFWAVKPDAAEKILKLKSGDRVAVGGGAWVVRHHQFWVWNLCGDARGL